MYRSYAYNEPRSHQGFTLIELMIVVAIIGILASVALPQYRTYIGRAIVTEGLSASGIYKVAYEEYVQTTSSYPIDISDIGVPTQIEGSYVSGAAAIASPPYFGYQITFSELDANSNALPAGIANNVIYFLSTPINGTNLSKGLKWRCSVDYTSGGVFEKFVPSSCRGNL